MSQFPITRMRRLRHLPAIRHLVREHTLTPHDFIMPLFIHYGTHIKQSITSMPGQYQISVDYLLEEIQQLLSLGIHGALLFGIPGQKDDNGSDAYAENGIIQTAIRTIKKAYPDFLIITDVCFCEYTSHGHCGIMNKKTGQLDLDNDATLELLGVQAVSHAKAGADIIAPSGSIDGMVHAIRLALDHNQFQHIPILSYAIKFSSALYGPFREAVNSKPTYGDRKTYQMDPANGQQALRDASLDIAEGADMLMVKPAMSYEDLIYQLKQHHPGIPLAAYQVSGEYAMLKAASQNGWLNEKQVVLEILTSLKRAGADFIISYYAKEAIKWLLGENKS